MHSSLSDVDSGKPGAVPLLNEIKFSLNILRRGFGGVFMTHCLIDEVLGGFFLSLTGNCSKLIFFSLV